MFVVRLIPVVLMHLAAIPCSLSYADQPKNSDATLTANFFPMRVGDKWIYAYGDKEVVFHVLRSETVKKRKLFVVRRTIDKTSVNFKLSIRTDGVYIHQEGEKRFVPPLRQFAFAAKTGETWKWQGTYGGDARKEAFLRSDDEQVTVPAGKYSAIVVVQHNRETADLVQFYLAKGVGVVELAAKTELIPDPEFGKVQFDWRLKRFERVKD